MKQNQSNVNSKMDEVRSHNVRRKNLCFLMHRYLSDNGFYRAADALKEEARLAVDLELCENVDLDGIYLEYANFYHLKFGKYPKFLRSVHFLPTLHKYDVNGRRKKQLTIKALTPKTGASNGETSAPGDSAENHDLSVTITPLNVTVCEGEGNNNGNAQFQNLDSNESLARLSDIEHGFHNGSNFVNSQDWQYLSELVQNTIMKDDIKLDWQDMSGNKNIVEIVKEAVLVPLEFPKLFANGLKPWKSVLLHGPPGTGKTHLARILYAETRAKVTFFNVTSSIIISKWRGESEKILRVLFHIARQRAPAIIFFDEIEGLTSKRDRATDHEASKRFKNEMLQMFDGLEQINNGVFILASTNLPWEIDDAFLRRFEKKLLIELPNFDERTKLIQKLVMGTVKLQDNTIKDLGKKSENFTGDEIRLACKEIGMQAVRLITKGMQPNEATMVAAFDQVKPISVRLLPKHLEWQKLNGF